MPSNKKTNIDKTSITAHSKFKGSKVAKNAKYKLNSLKCQTWGFDYIFNWKNWKNICCNAIWNIIFGKETKKTKDSLDSRIIKHKLVERYSSGVFIIINDGYI